MLSPLKHSFLKQQNSISFLFGLRRCFLLYSISQFSWELLLGPRFFEMPPFRVVSSETPLEASSASLRESTADKAWKVVELRILGGADNLDQDGTMAPKDVHILMPRNYG